MLSLLLGRRGALGYTVAMTARRASDDRRFQREWRAGIRARGRWPVLGLVLLGLCGLLAGVGPLFSERWTASFRAALEGSPMPAIKDYVAATLSVAAVFLCAVVVAALVFRRVGAVRGSAGALSAVGHSGSPGFGLLAPAAALLLCGWAVGPVVAGASRAADASAPGLEAFWWGWTINALLGFGVLLVGCGVVEQAVERWLARRAQRGGRSGGSK